MATDGAMKKKERDTGVKVNKEAPPYLEGTVKWHARKSRRRHDYLNSGGTSILGQPVHAKRSIVMSWVFSGFITYDVMAGDNISFRLSIGKNQRRFANQKQ